MKYAWKSFGRYRRSKGFGVHSSFAFNFILNVLRERLPYYSYNTIAELREQIVENHPTTLPITQHYAELLFRVTNRFNPSEIIVVGESDDVAILSLLLPNSKSKIIAYENSDITISFLNPTFKDRILSTATLQQINHSSEKRFIVVHNPSNTCFDEITNYLSISKEIESVVVMLNLNDKLSTLSLWENFKTEIKHGMTFRNNVIGIAVCTPKLPRQDFELCL